MYYLFYILSVLGLIALLALSAVKVFVHFVILKPLIEFKLQDSVENPDPDFDFDKYIDWK